MSASTRPRPTFFYCSWIRRVNVAVPMTWTSEAPGGLDGIVALTSSSSSSTGIDRACFTLDDLSASASSTATNPLFSALFAGDLLFLCVYNVLVVRRLSVILATIRSLPFPLRASTVNTVYIKLSSSFSLTHPHLHISGGMRTLAAWHKSQSALTIFGASIIVRSSSFLLFPPTPLSPAPVLRANASPFLFSN
jgi:hypothetical protein